MDSNTKLCPNCGLLHPDSALACNCGHDFKAHDLRKPLDNQRKTFLSWCLLPFKKYAEFSGRSRRKEYWTFVLFLGMVEILLLLIVETFFEELGELLALGLFFGFLGFFIGCLIPYFALSVRRLHDTSHSGWWLLIGFVPFGGLYLFYLFVSDSDPGENKYGPNPKTANTGSPDTT